MDTVSPEYTWAHISPTSHCCYTELRGKVKEEPRDPANLQSWEITCPASGRCTNRKKRLMGNGSEEICPKMHFPSKFTPPDLFSLQLFPPQIYLLDMRNHRRTCRAAPREGQGHTGFPTQRSSERSSEKTRMPWTAKNSNVIQATSAWSSSSAGTSPVMGMFSNIGFSSCNQVLGRDPVPGD